MENKMIKSVYNGYQETYMTGKEIKEFMVDAYVTFGKHHSKISSTRIDFKYYPKILNDERYRIFYNDNFFRIMDVKNDELVYFIGYTKTKPSWAKD